MHAMEQEPCQHLSAPCIQVSWPVRLASCREKPHRCVGKYQHQCTLGLLQFEFHRDQYPHGHGFTAAAGRLKTPAPHGFHGRMVQVWVSCRALDLEILDSPLRRNAHLQEHCPLDAPPPGRLWIARFDLIAADGASRDTSPTAAPTPGAGSTSARPCASAGTRAGAFSASTATSAVPATATTCSYRHTAVGRQSPYVCRAAGSRL